MHNHYLVFPQFNPIIFSFGPVSFHWYGLMYLLSFVLIRWLARRRITQFCGTWNKDDVDKLMYVGFLGVFFGGRLGYMLFYNLPLFFDDPICIFKIWNGGMSFHGGLIGVIIALSLFCHYNKFNFFSVSDFLTPFIPLGLGAGRFGNYINGELWGRVNFHIPWGMLFPASYNEDIKLAVNNPEWQQFIFYHGALPRHPSQLYEVVLEGLLLFVILHWFVSSHVRPIGATSGLFLIIYSVFRIFVEFFRQPDQQIGLFYGVSMGQILSVPMFICGVFIMLLAYNKGISIKNNS
ncbi:prolipoprotein diacylglyceryl transferase [Candidatus Erwinia haradaeae]|uniref:Phosphatidylglycerol--prolipoprotein diacylglyceryl transferase n=1 Tax=Candidatus Erwinia haradaeae TaxID=1922217 RepID=A0A451D1H1_9GAMM|nr:prolipoprotein diacylglyceryl transferase [Candidatus Erwinia haradaeae]VFP79466.1 Prolipoprotein diacylglyceryl transferase [Candidatus Erwinia haradaeae]